MRNVGGDVRLAGKTQICSWGGDADLGIPHLDDGLPGWWIRSSRVKTAWNEKRVKTTCRVGSGEVKGPRVSKEEREWRVRNNKEQSASIIESQTSVSMTTRTSPITNTLLWDSVHLCWLEHVLIRIFPLDIIFSPNLGIKKLWCSVLISWILRMGIQLKGFETSESKT